MKVKDLIEELKKQNPEATIYCWDFNRDDYYEVTKVNSISSQWRCSDEDGLEII